MCLTLTSRVSLFKCSLTRIFVIGTESIQEHARPAPPISVNATARDSPHMNMPRMNAGDVIHVVFPRIVHIYLVVEMR